MKRTRFRAIIANFIYELNVDPDECDEKAEDLLQELEDAGMIGPYDSETSLENLN